MTDDKKPTPGLYQYRITIPEIIINESASRTLVSVNAYLQCHVYCDAVLPKEEFTMIFYWYDFGIAVL